jgi:hypothetical protein
MGSRHPWERPSLKPLPERWNDTTETASARWTFSGIGPAAPAVTRLPSERSRGLGDDVRHRQPEVALDPTRQVPPKPTRAALRQHRPVPGSSRTTSSLSGCTTQTVPAPTARPAGFRPPAGNRATTRLERGSTRTTSWSRHAPTHRLPAPKTSGPPPWPTSIRAVTQRSGRVRCWGDARVVVGVGSDRDAGSSWLVMRPTTASTATAPSRAALTRSLSRCEAMRWTSPATSPEGHLLPRHQEG